MRRGAFAVLAVGALAALTVVGNEIFLVQLVGTRSAPPPVHLAGTWHDADSEIRIAADGSVTGYFGGEQIREGRVRVNRTWVGRKLELRSDYRIDAETVSGLQLRAPLSLHAGKLEGAWFAGPDFKGNGPSKASLTRH